MRTLRRTLLLPWIILPHCYCSNSHNKTIAIDADSLGSKTALQLPDSIQEPEPVWGHRFSIKGDFDGNGKMDTLVEHFFSKRDNAETNKFYKNMTYEELVSCTVEKQPYSFLTSSDKNIDTLQIYDGDQQLGLSFIKNEGDLDGDGGDEVSYVVNFADWSALNSCHLMSYKQNSWKILYTFQIWDWQIPDVHELEKFGGFIKKIKPGKIEVVLRKDTSEQDTVVVYLKRAVVRSH